MPLKLKEPRKGKTLFWQIRGTHLGIYVDKSSGSPRRSVAGGIRDGIERAIESGEYPPKKPDVPEAGSSEPTFLSAAIAYAEFHKPSKKYRRYINHLVRHFREKPLSEFNQAVIDSAAIALNPNAGPAGRNSMVYTPVSAILHHHYGDKLPFNLARPPGGKGKRRTQWLVPTDAFGIIEAAETFDIEFATLLTSLLYIGMRVCAGLDLQREEVRADELAAWIRHQKDQPAADVRLRPEVCDRLVTHLESHDRRRVFRFHYGGHLKYLLVRAKLVYLGIPHPLRRPVPWREPDHRLKWVTFHTWRHTWATWMRRYARATIDDLVDSGNWRDRKSAMIYVHATPDDVWNSIHLLPSMKKKVV